MPSTASQTLSQTRTTSPKKYMVIMHNDDFTTMDFVIDVLISIFFKSREVATQLMLDVHHKGQAIVGIYTYDVATSKVHKATVRAAKEGFPFRLTIEPVESDLPF